MNSEERTTRKKSKTLGERRAWLSGEMGAQHRLLFLVYFELWNSTVPGNLKSKFGLHFWEEDNELKQSAVGVWEGRVLLG